MTEAAEHQLGQHHDLEILWSDNNAPMDQLQKIINKLLNDDDVLSFTPHDVLIWNALVAFIDVKESDV